MPDQDYRKLAEIEAVGMGLPDHGWAIPAEKYEARVGELLEANNPLLERARKAERERDDAMAGIGAAAKFIECMARHLKDPNDKETA